MCVLLFKDTMWNFLKFIKEIGTKTGCDVEMLKHIALK